MRRLNNVERLQVLLAVSIAAEPNKRFVDPELVAEFVANGDEWALRWEYEWFDNEPHPKDNVVDEVVEILSMYQHLQQSETEISGQITRTRCDGFDGNTDEHYGVAQVLVRKLNRFTHVDGADENAHSAAALLRHRARLSRYRPLRIAVQDEPGGYRFLTEEEILAVLS